MDPVITSAAVKVGELTEKLADSSTKDAGALLARLFGPSADVIGEHWADQLRKRNLDRLLRKTESHATRVENLGGAGFANPRVASHVLETAQFADQEVVSEYLSGILASSRDPSGRDDAGVAWSSLISRLSSAQLRLHYAVYGSTRPLVCTRPQELYDRDFRRRGIVVQFDRLLSACGFADSEDCIEALDGLGREGLIGEDYEFRAASDREGRVDHRRIVLSVCLSVHGARLFLWGNGAGRLPVDAYADHAIRLEPIDAKDLPVLDLGTRWRDETSSHVTVHVRPRRFRPVDD